MMQLLSSKRRSSWIVAAALTATVALPVAAWADVERHSGTVVAVEGGTQAFVLEEIGPGRPGQAGNEVARMRISLGQSTPVIAVARSADTAPDGWPGGFVEERSGLAALREGAFVTVTLRREQGQLTAEQVTVMASSTLGDR